MLNIEKYKNELKRKGFSSNLCAGIMQIRTNGGKCTQFKCLECGQENLEWLCEEYKEPEVDWSKVPKGTMVEVKDFDDDEWNLRKFYCYDSDFAYPYLAYNEDGTAVSMWRYCRLAEDE